MLVKYIHCRKERQSVKINIAVWSLVTKHSTCHNHFQSAKQDNNYKNNIITDFQHTTAWRGATGRPAWAVNCSAEGCGKPLMWSWLTMASLRTIGRWTYELVDARGRPNRELEGRADDWSATPLLYRQTCMLFTAKLNLPKNTLMH